MSVVAVLGDVATTTTLAVAAARSQAGLGDADDREATLVVEADPTGGSAGAWADLPVAPTLSTVVTRAVDGGWPAVRALVHDAPSGLRMIPAPPRSMEAARAVAEAEHWLFGLLAALDHPVAVVDLGDPTPARGAPAALAHADVAIVVHRQATQSARAAAVRIERLAELVDVVGATGCPFVLAVVGATPFDPAEIARFVGEPHRGDLRAHVPGLGRGHGADEASLPLLVELPEDPLAAAVLGGRSGVSARRFARLPLMRAAAGLATGVADRMRTRGGVP